MKPSTEVVFAISMTLRAKRSFGLIVLSTLDSFIATWCVKSSDSDVGEPVGIVQVERITQVTPRNNGLCNVTTSGMAYHSGMKGSTFNPVEAGPMYINDTDRQ